MILRHLKEGNSFQNLKKNNYDCIHADQSIGPGLGDTAKRVTR